MENYLSIAGAFALAAWPLWLVLATLTVVAWIERAR